MTGSLVSTAVPLPRGVLASTVIGMAAAGVGWLLAGFWPTITGDDTRLDQLMALGIGALTGAIVSGARAFRQRESVSFHGAAGALLGGVGALAGASLMAFGHQPASPYAFLSERMLAWAFTAAGAALPLALLVDRHDLRRTTESTLIAFVGGAISGVIFTLPGAPEVWQGIASLWLGATIGFAVAGPELWHAIATLELVPGRGEKASLVAFREMALHEGRAISLGEAQVAAIGGRVALYPPAGGMVAGGHSVRQPEFLTESAMLVVGRTRYRLQLQRAP